MTDADTLAELGMTDGEIELWLALEGVAARIAALPELHPMAAHETAHALHRLQDLLLGRPGMRAQGWGAPPDAAPDADERHRRLLAYGLSEGELALWYDVAGIAGRMLELPEAGPDDRHELVHGMHRVQDQLLARPGRRGVGG
jgi:hypothetical protein